VAFLAAIWTLLWVVLWELEPLSLRATARLWELQPLSSRAAAHLGKLNDLFSGAPLVGSQRCQERLAVEAPPKPTQRGQEIDVEAGRVDVTSCVAAASPKVAAAATAAAPTATMQPLQCSPRPSSRPPRSIGGRVSSIACAHPRKMTTTATVAAAPISPCKSVQTRCLEFYVGTPPSPPSDEACEAAPSLPLAVPSLPLAGQLARAAMRRVVESGKEKDRETVSLETVEDCMSHRSPLTALLAQLPTPCRSGSDKAMQHHEVAAKRGGVAPARAAAARLSRGGSQGSSATGRAHRSIPALVPLQSRPGSPTSGKAPSRAARAFALQPQQGAA